jgi:hypothetical protein
MMMEMDENTWVLRRDGGEGRLKRCGNPFG